MSTIDDRIVRMQFDNAQFEAGVAKSMQTLDNLNKKLESLSGFAEGASEMAKGLGSGILTGLKGISTGVQKIEQYTTTIFGKIADKFKTEVADKIYNSLTSIPTKAMAQIKSGGWNRAMNIANAQFQIEGLKYSWEAVRQAADYAVTDTAYGFDEAAKAASQLAASGVDFEKIIGKDGAGKDVTQMHKSLRAISGLAAMTNSSFDDIAHVFTRIAGQGKVMANDLNSIAARGINAAATLAEQMGVTEAEIRDMVSKGNVSFMDFAEAMDDAFGEHSKEANKTFTGSLSNMKAALSRIGAIFTQPVIDKTNTFFVAVTGRIKEFQKALNDTTGYRLTEKGLKSIQQQALKAAKELDGVSDKDRASFVEKEIERLKKLSLGDQLKKSLDAGDAEQYSIIRFAGHFAEAWESAVNAASKVVESLDLNWFSNIGAFFDKIAVKAKAFFDNVSKYLVSTKQNIEDTVTSTVDALGFSLSDFRIIEKIMAGELGTMQYRWDQIDKMMNKKGEGLRIQGYVDQLAQVGYSYEKMGWTEDWIKEKEKEAAEVTGDLTSEVAKLVKQRKEQAAQTVKAASAEEIAYQNIGYAIENIKDAITEAKRIVSDLVKIIGNVGAGAGRLLSYFDLIGVGLQPENILGPIADVTDALVDFTSTVELPQDGLIALGDAMERVGTFVTDFLKSVGDTTASVIRFAAECIMAEQSLDELSENENLSRMQMDVLSVLKVIRDLGTAAKNIGKAILAVIKPITKAFANVFNASGVLEDVSDLTGGIAALTEKLIISENTAEIIEKTLTILFTIIGTTIEKVTDAIGWIGSLVKGTKKADAAIEDVTKTTKDVLKVSDNAESKFSGLKTKLSGFFDVIKSIPSKLVELKDALAKQEGIVRLKESLLAVGTVIKDKLATTIPTVKDEIVGAAKVMGGKGKSAIEMFADGVGVVAGKISDFINKIPDYIKKVEDFFDRVKKKIDDTAQKLHIGEFLSGLGKAFDVTGTTEGTIAEKIKAFITGISDKITELLDSIDWKKITRIAFIGVIFKNLLNVLTITKDIHNLITSVTSVPKTIGAIFKSLAGLFTQASTSLKKFTAIYIFYSLASALASLVAGVIVLGNMDESKMKAGIAALTWIAVLMSIMGLVVAKVAESTMSRNVPKVIQETNNSKMGVIELTNNIGGSFGFAAALGSLAAALFVLFKGIVDVMHAVQGLTHTEIDNAWRIMLRVLVGVGALIAAIAGFMLFSKKIHIGKNESKALVGLALAIAAFGAAVWLVTKAMLAINDLGDDFNWSSFGAIMAISAALIVITYVIGKTVKGINIKSFIGLAIVLAVIGGIMWSILAEILVLSAALVPSEAYASAVWQSVGVLATMLVALGGFVFLVGKGLSKVDKAGPMIAVIASMAAIVLFIGIAVSMMAKSLSNVDGWTQGVIILGMVAMLGIIAAGVANMLKQLNAQKSFLGSDGAWKVLMLAVVIAAMGATILMIAEAAAIMQQANAAGGVLASIGFLLVISVAINKIITNFAKLDGDKASNLLFSLAIAFIAIAGSLYIFALAAKEMSTVDLGTLGLMAVVLVVLLGVFALMAVLMNTSFAPAIEKASTIFLTFSISVLILSAAVLLLGVGFGVLAAGCGALALGIDSLAKTLSEHWVMALIGIAIMALIIYFVIQVVDAIKIGMVTVGEIAGKLVSIVSNLIEGIVKLLGAGSKKLSAWWGKQSTNVKLAVATTLVGIAAGIVAATPEMLDSVKQVIQKIVYFIIDIIPTLVDAVFDIVIRLLNALADTIRKNSAQVAYAFWNIIESLIEVLLDVLVQGILIVANAVRPLIEWLADKFGWDIDFDSWASDMKEGFSVIKASMREGMTAAQDYTDSTETMVQAFSGLDSSLSKVTKDIQKNGNAVKKANGQFVAAEDSLSGFSISANSLLGNGAGMNAFSSFLSSDTFGNLGADYFKTGSDAGGQAGDGFIDGMVSKFTGSSGGLSIPGMEGMDPSTLMDQAGMGTDAFNMEGMMSGEAWGEGMGESYDNAAAQEISSPDNREQIYEASSEVIVDETERAFKDAEPQIKESTTKHVTNSVTTAITSGFPQIFASAGQIIPGIIGVLEAGKPMLEAKAAELGDIMDKGFRSKDGIDSNSPSKKFYNSGLWCVLGVANAIDQNTGLASDAMLNLSDQMISSFGDPLDYVSKIASGEIQYDPSIRPILDTSMIGRGAGAINSMFTHQNVSLAGMTGQIAYDMSTLNGSNAAVVAEIQALREDMDYMTEQMTNMQIVMDTGALVGATSGAMDKNLGIKRLYSERGDL